jgi:hypothetical protein
MSLFSKPKEKTTEDAINELCSVLYKTYEEPKGGENSNVLADRAGFKTTIGKVNVHIYDAHKPVIKFSDENGNELITINTFQERGEKYCLIGKDGQYMVTSDPKKERLLQSFDVKEICEGALAEVHKKSLMINALSVGPQPENFMEKLLQPKESSINKLLHRIPANLTTPQESTVTHKNKL